MLAGYNVNITPVSINLGSVVSGTTSMPVLKAPFGGMTVLDWSVVADDTLNGSGSNYATFTLLNGGAVGTATTSIGTAGGTAGYTALTPVAGSVNAAADELTVDQFLVLKGVMTGAIADNQFNAIIRWVRGKG